MESGSYAKSDETDRILQQTERSKDLNKTENI